jgi:hypothetical protein
MMHIWKGLVKMMTYQEENEGHQSLSFIVSDRAGTAELATHDVELMGEEQHPSKKHLRKSK